MALKVPETFLSKDETRRYGDREEGLFFRLPPNHVADLRDVARGVEESDAGVCCSYLVDSMSGEGGDFDEHALNALERFAEQALTFEFLSDTFGAPVVSSWRARIQRCRRAVQKLHEAGDSRSASVLFVAYGYPDPIVRQLPDLLELGYVLAPLARYSDTVEERRQEMVRELAARSSISPGRVPEDSVGGGRERWAALYDLVHARETRARADRVLSSGDALRDALSAFPEDGELKQRAGESYAAFEARKAERKERREAHRQKRAAFLSAVRVDVVRMLSLAEKAYHDAWLRSAVSRSGGDGFRCRRDRAEKRGPVLPPARVRGSGWSVGE